MITEDKTIIVITVNEIPYQETKLFNMGKKTNSNYNHLICINKSIFYRLKFKG